MNAAKSIRVLVVDDNGFTWHLDCEEVTMTSLAGDTAMCSRSKGKKSKKTKTKKSKRW